MRTGAGLVGIAVVSLVAARSARADLAPLTAGVGRVRVEPVGADAAERGRRPLPVVRLGAPGDGVRLARARVAVAPIAGGIELQLSLWFDADAGITRREAILPLTLPPGARVTGTAIALGRDRPSVAILLAVDAARAAYLELRNVVVRDPLLVEATAADAYQIRAFPLDPGGEARVDLAIVLPPLARVAFDPTGQHLDQLAVTGAVHATRRDVRRKVVIALPAALPASASAPLPPAAVTPATSLYAGPLRQHVDGPDDDAAGAAGELDKQLVRRALQLARDRFAHCYAHEIELLARGAVPEGELVAHFVIGRSGAVLRSSVDGELDNENVRACFAAEVAALRFPPSAGQTVVNYPVRFQLH